MGIACTGGFGCGCVMIIRPGSIGGECGGVMDELAIGFTLPQLTPRHFSFNSHLGACAACHGLGTEQVCDPDLIVDDPDKGSRP